MPLLSRLLSAAFGSVPAIQAHQRSAQASDSTTAMACGPPFMAEPANSPIKPSSRVNSYGTVDRMNAAGEFTIEPIRTPQELVHAWRFLLQIFPSLQARWPGARFFRDRLTGQSPTMLAA